jgi:hypothetical protein
MDWLPVISQFKFGFQYVCGDAKGALEAGHLKGGIHHLCGDHDGGNRALKSSSRTTGVIVGGVGGFAVGGPVGAFAGGIGGVGC